MTDFLAGPRLLTWIGIFLCLGQAGVFSGLNLAALSVSRLRLEIEAASGNRDAAKLLALREHSHLLLATILWGNVAANVLLTLLSESVLAGVGAFVFSTFVLTIFGEIAPQAYFSRHAIRVAGRLTPMLNFYRVALFPVAKPTAMLLDWWLGREGLRLFRERDFRALMGKHIDVPETELSQFEVTGALNFLDLDDISVLEEGEPIDPRSIVSLPIRDGRPALPRFAPSPDDPFLRKLHASGKKWVIFIDPSGQPYFVLDAHHFLRDVLFGQLSVGPEAYWHRPIVVTDTNAQLGDVIGQLRVKPEHPRDDVIDHDLILVWGRQKRIITGADLLGRLLLGIARRDSPPV
ncbi:MAG: CNNM domain-containing protein [Pseudolabrys sp.]